MVMERRRLPITLESLIRQHEENNKKTTTTAAYQGNQKTNMSEIRKRVKKTCQQRDCMSKLPCHVAMDIFCKLPIRSLIYCRWVCKAWRDLILDPRFARLHLTTIPPSTVLIFQFDSLEMGGQTNVYMVEPDACPRDAITKLNNCSFYIPKLKTITIVGSCNGLLCFRDNWSPYSFHISNPVTGECMTLPNIKTDPKNLVAFGFGFSLKNNQYKVITMHPRQKAWDFSEHSWRWHMEAEIYTVGIGTWKTILCTPYFFYGSSGIFLNGALHWIARDVNRTAVICAFDVGNEQFQTIPLPPISFFGRANSIYWLNIGELGGHLYIACEHDVSHSKVDIWMMKDYGVKETWTRALVIRGSGVQYRWDRNKWVQLIRFSINMETLMLVGQTITDMISYNPRSSILRKLNDHGSQSRIRVFHHIPSFLSLQDIMMAESSEINFQSR